MREACFWPKMKFEPIFFSGSLAVFRNRKPTGECWRVMAQNAAFSNWRCVFEKIQTDFAQNL
jgi:hypothetical protein